MARNRNDIIILRKQRKPNRTFLTFLGILGFVAVVVCYRFNSNSNPIPFKRNPQENIALTPLAYHLMIFTFI
ncbi:hypothetical protein ES703_29201 [subsurface metagenome]